MTKEQDNTKGAEQGKKPNKRRSKVLGHGDRFQTYIGTAAHEDLISFINKQSDLSSTVLYGFLVLQAKYGDRDIRDYLPRTFNPEVFQEDFINKFLGGNHNIVSTLLSEDAPVIEKSTASENTVKKENYIENDGDGETVEPIAKGSTGDTTTPEPTVYDGETVEPVAKESTGDTTTPEPTVHDGNNHKPQNTDSSGVASSDTTSSPPNKAGGMNIGNMADMSKAFTFNKK